MRGRTNIVQRIGATVNGDQVTAKALENIEMGSFVEVVRRPQYGVLSQTGTNILCVKVSDDLWAVCYIRTLQVYLSLMRLVDLEFLFVDTVLVFNGYTKDRKIIASSGGKVIVSYGNDVYVYGVSNFSLNKLFEFNSCPQGFTGDLKEMYIDSDENLYVYFWGSKSGKKVCKYVLNNGYVLSKEIDLTSIGSGVADVVFFTSPNNLLLIVESSVYYIGLNYEAQSYQQLGVSIISVAGVVRAVSNMFQGKILVCYIDYQTKYFLYMIDVSGGVLQVLNLSFNTTFVKNSREMLISAKGNDVIVVYRVGYTVTDYPRILYFKYDELLQSLSFVGEISATEPSAYSLSAVLNISDSDKALLSSNFNCYMFAIGNYEISKGLEDLIDGVKNYTNQNKNPMGFVKTGASVGEMVTVYVPHK